MENQIGKQIRIHRLRCSMTQEKLAERLNVTAQAISKWETGSGCPDISLLPELSAALGITVDELFESSIETHLRRIGQMLENNPVMCREDFDYAQTRLKEGCLDAETRCRCLTLLAELYNHRAQMYHDRAAETAKEALVLEPQKKDNHTAFSQAAGGVLWDWCCSNHSRVISFYQEFVKKNPDYWAGYLWLMDNLIADRRLKEARQALEALYRVKQSYHYPLYKGWIAFAEGDVQLAECIWDDMVAAEPENWFVWSTRADAYAKRGQYEKAIADYRRATELEDKPRFTDNYDSIAQLCLLRGDKAGAIEAYRQVVQILREDWCMQEGETVQGYLENIAQAEAERR